MSKPVKVNEKLYEELRVTAEQNEITIQDALRRKLEVHRDELAKVSKEQENIRRELKGKEEQLAQVGKERKSERTRVSKLQSEMAELKGILDELNKKRSDLEEDLKKTRDRAEQSEADASEREAALTRQKKTFQGMAVFFGLLVLAGLVYKLWRRRRTAREEQKKERQVPYQQMLNPWEV